MSSRMNSQPAEIPDVVRVAPGTVDALLAERVANVLRRGGLVAMRTDTVYGLLASVNRPDALERLVRMKVRPRDKPFVLLAADWVSVRAVTSSVPPVARALGSRYWPGPLTLVLPAALGLPAEVTASGSTVAVRVPGDPMLREVVAATRCAVAAPSANRHGEEPAGSAADCAATFGAEIDLIVDGGEVENRKPSTIVNCLGEHAEIIRDGAVPLSGEELRC